MQFSLDRKQRRHKQDQCSASDSVGLIFTRSYSSTLLIATPTTTPSLVKTNLKQTFDSFGGIKLAPRIAADSDKMYMHELIYKL